MSHRLSRRSGLRLSLTASVAATLLAACGTNSPNATTAGASTPVAPPPPPVASTPVTTICGLSDQVRTCDQTVISPAPPNHEGVTTPPTPTQFAPVANPGSGEDNKCDYTGSTAGSSTTNMAVTVFVPPHNAGETFPLILHSHGWGGSRATAIVSTDVQPADANTFIGIAENIGAVVNAGYIVISFDERGWGESTADNAQARVIDPCYETVDAMAIVDWAIDPANNLPVAMEAPNDPVLGTIGGSYGGAFQLMLAAMDDRVDAIMPVATWNLLAPAVNPLKGTGATAPTTLDGSIDVMHSSFMPNDGLQRGYIYGLCILAGTAMASLDEIVQRACQTVTGASASEDPPSVSAPPQSFTTVTSGDSMDQADANAQPTAHTGDNTMRALFARNGMGNPNLRINRPPMDVDVLLVQGSRDVLFNGNDAYANYQFFSDPSNNNPARDVKIITTNGGHMLSTFEAEQQAYASGNSPFDRYQKQGNNACGSFDMFSGMINWLDQKLKGVAPTNATEIPEICISLESNITGAPVPVGTDKGATFTAMPIGFSLFATAPAAYDIPTQTVNSSTATNMDIIASPRQFLALATIPGSTPGTPAGYIAGIPLLDVQVDAIALSLEMNPTAFVSIGIMRNGQLHEVDEEVVGIKRANTAADPAISYTNIHMPLVGQELHEGDVVGIILHRYHGQYVGLQPTPVEYILNEYEFTGSIEIPMFDLNNQPMRP